MRFSLTFAGAKSPAGSVSASQRLGLSASGARGPTPQVAGTGSYPLEWTLNGPGSNLEGGATRGGRSEWTLNGPGSNLEGSTTRGREIIGDY